MTWRWRSRQICGKETESLELGRLSAHPYMMVLSCYTNSMQRYKLVTQRLLLALSAWFERISFFKKKRPHASLRGTLSKAKLQEAMIQEFLQPNFRYKLRDALNGSEGDVVKQAPRFAWLAALCSRV